MKLNDNTEAKKVLSELYTDINNQKDIDKEDYSKDFVLKTYNLLNKNYSFQYLFSRLRDDRNVQATLAELENGEDYIEQIDQFAHNVNFAIH
ncbi:hypothetical protein [Companilactobacillus pabuli]|mgnify:FL=1|jgi:hypothetical protein|uniref:Bacteriocin immunity protein n=1 Tax=Companilactobacillus pabuli TaxID=2714036 RepID=A0A7L7KZS2_9LACO|nr:hypothetical protein [Companilactobacillus pabuli]AKP02186.1 hypothetical protein ABB45_00180 [Companilactobacillus farciminis]AKS50483.1 hypothetical protein ABB44_00180 [Companilactobacillus farciminis]MDG5113567.1 hypothetical protein [Companilactobacillus pabuli]QMT85311.1 hypothetical protein G6534_03305 [Companilactobacillus pabuli]GAQ01790.1 hypothetical protein NBRC111452_1605 [Companilactobacillus farciminis]